MMVPRIKREKIGLMDTGAQVLLKMAEGNPGAITVLAEMTKGGTDGFFAILGLDDMNNRDTAMVEKINEVCAPTAQDEKAVTYGASFKR